MPPGQVGEIWLKAPTVIKGYFNLPEATAAAFTDGWFHTGDAGRLDEEGYLYVVDRLKDVVIRGGENIYAAEVEAALYEHPDITEAAIIGVPHPRLGEEVGAVIRLRDGATLDRGRRPCPYRRAAGRIQGAVEGMDHHRGTAAHRDRQGPQAPTARNARRHRLTHHHEGPSAMPDDSLKG